jgi:hypothetical protein
LLKHLKEYYSAELLESGVSNGLLKLEMQDFNSNDEIIKKSSKPAHYTEQKSFLTPKEERKKSHPLRDLIKKQNIILKFICLLKQGNEDCLFVVKEYVTD